MKAYATIPDAEPLVLTSTSGRRFFEGNPLQALKPHLITDVDLVNLSAVGAVDRFDLAGAFQADDLTTFAAYNELVKPSVAWSFAIAQAPKIFEDRYKKKIRTRSVDYDWLEGLAVFTNAVEFCHLYLTHLQIAIRAERLRLTARLSQSKKVRSVDREAVLYGRGRPRKDDMMVKSARMREMLQMVSAAVHWAIAQTEIQAIKWGDAFKQALEWRLGGSFDGRQARLDSVITWLREDELGYWIDEVTRMTEASDMNLPYTPMHERKEGKVRKAPVPGEQPKIVFKRVQTPTIER